MRHILIGAAILLAYPAYAADTNLVLWVADLQRAEEMIAAAIETGDGPELKRQSYAVNRLTGRAWTEVPDKNRLACVSASNALANTAHSLLGDSPASALVNARADAKIYREEMAACEKSVGVRGKRRLRL